MELNEHTLQWLRDLLSGEFTQGFGALTVGSVEHGMAYCCLGVLGTRITNAPDGFVGELYLSNHDFARATGGRPDDQKSLGCLNDGHLRFDRIADVIAFAIIENRSIHGDLDEHLDQVPEGTARRLLAEHDAEEGR